MFNLGLTLNGFWTTRPSGFAWSSVSTVTAFHAAVKLGQILLQTSQKMEENDFMGSKGQVFVLRFVDFDLNYFCCYIFHFVTFKLVVMTGVDQQCNIHKILFP